MHNKKLHIFIHLKICSLKVCIQMDSKNNWTQASTMFDPNIRIKKSLHGALKVLTKPTTVF